MRAVLAILVLLVLAPAAAAAPERRDPPHLARDPAHQGQDASTARPTATATRSPRTTSARWPRPTSRSTASARATSGPTATLREPRQRRDVQQPRLGLLLPADQGRPGRRGAARAAAAGRARCPRSARACAATRPATTPTCARSACDGIPDPRCRGKAWVRPITELDVFRRFYQLALLACAGRRDRRHRAGAAARRRRAAAGGRAPPLPTPRRPRHAQDRLPLGGLGSNAVALGKEATQRTARACCSATRTSPGTGPSASTRRSSRSRARSTSPARRCSACRSILIGHTRDLAWSHTVSTAFRFTPFELKLVPGSPTTYLVDGQPQRDDARRRSRSRRARPTARSSRARARSTRPSSARCSPRCSGCRCSRGRRRPPTRWATRTPTNFRLPQPLLRDQPRAEHGASSTRSSAATRASRGSTRSPPTRAAARTTPTSGRSRTSPTRRSQRCNTTALGQATFDALGLPVLDGSRSACDWGSDPDAAAPGILGPARMPSLFRDDYVTNSNDSYWLSNPEQPLEGFARIIGDERTERSLRTRTRAADRRRPAARRRPTFTRRMLQDAVFANRQLRRRADARRARRVCRASRTSAAGAATCSRRWDLHDEPRLQGRGAVPPLRVAAARRRARRPPGIWRHAVRRRATRSTRRAT